MWSCISAHFSIFPPINSSERMLVLCHCLHSAFNFYCWHTNYFHIFTCGRNIICRCLIINSLHPSISIESLDLVPKRRDHNNTHRHTLHVQVHNIYIQNIQGKTMSWKVCWLPFAQTKTLNWNSADSHVFYIYIYGNLIELPSV